MKIYGQYDLILNCCILSINILPSLISRRIKHEVMTQEQAKQATRQNDQLKSSCGRWLGDVRRNPLGGPQEGKVVKPQRSSLFSGLLAIRGRKHLVKSWRSDGEKSMERI